MNNIDTAILRFGIRKTQFISIGLSVGGVTIAVALGTIGLLSLLASQGVLSAPLSSLAGLPMGGAVAFLGISPLVGGGSIAFFILMAKKVRRVGMKGRGVERPFLESSKKDEKV